MLHQAMEQSCSALIRVFTGYRSDIHGLARLIHFSKCFSDLPERFFSGGPNEEERLFKLLQNSYSETRYKEGFTVTEKDASSLLEKVHAFTDMAEKICLKRIAELEQAAIDISKTASIEKQYDVSNTIAD